MKNIRHAQPCSPIGPFCVTLLFPLNALNPEPTDSVNILLSEQFRSPAHGLHMKPNRTPIRALQSIHNLANMAAVGVKLCVSATPVEGLQNVRATCRRLIVQTGGVQTVPDIQHEDAIKMTPTHSFGLQTEEGYGKSGFGFRIKIENKKDDQTNRVNEGQCGRISAMEERLSASEVIKEAAVEGFLSNSRLV